MSRIRNSQDIIESMVVEEDSEENVERDFLLRNNANNVFGIQLINKNITERAHAEYLFEKIIPKTASDLYDDGVIYIHDKSLQNYCISLDMKQVALEGIPTIAKNINESKPTKNFFTFMRHISNAVTLLANQVSGAVMLANFSTIIGTYIKYNTENGISREVTREELYREMKHLIWELNIPLRNGAETPFTNITMEFGKCSPVIADDYIIIGGKAMPEKYSELDPNYIEMVNDVFIDVMSHPPAPGKIYTFPLCTVQYDDDFDKTNVTYKKLIKHAKKTGGFYIENFKTTPFIESDFKDVNPLIKPKDPTLTRSMCCLRDDSKIKIYDSNNKEFNITIKEYCEMQKNEPFYIDSLNPETFKIERTKIKDTLIKTNDTHMICLKTNSKRELYMTYNHPLLLKEKSSGKVVKMTAKELLDMSYSNKYMIPVY